jgi:hypothetical protein
MNLLHYTHQGLGHESLSILYRFAHNLLSVLDPDSLVRRKLLTSLRPSRPQKQHQ